MSTTRYDFTRHGNTGKKGTDQHDSERRLTDKGTDQSRAIGKVLAEQVTGYDCVLSSPTLRCRETTSHALEAFGSMQSYPVALNELYPVDIPAIDTLFNQHGYSTLATYKGDSDHVAEFAEFTVWGHQALAAMEPFLKPLTGLDAAKIFVGGHAVCIPLIALLLVQAFDPSAVEEIGMILEINMGEGDVLSVVLHKDEDGDPTGVSVTHIVNPINEPALTS